MILPVGGDGLLEPAVLAEALRVPTLLVSIMAVNNEIGVIQDLPKLGALVKEAGAAFHVDAAQAAGRIPLDVAAMRADLLSLSGHKMYGPKGIGALYVRRRPRMRLSPLFSGGGQERGLRAGTLPVPLIVAIGEAARLAAAEGEQDAERLQRLTDRLLALLRPAVPGLVLNGHPQRRVAGNLNLTFPARAAKHILQAAPDLCLSTSSACTTSGRWRRRAEPCADRHRALGRRDAAQLAQSDWDVLPPRRTSRVPPPAWGPPQIRRPPRRSVRLRSDDQRSPRDLRADAEDDLRRARRNEPRG